MFKEIHPMKKTAIALALTAAISTQAYSAVDVVKIDGSSTVYPITEAVAEEFQKQTGIKVTVGVSGTGGGFKKFCRGETVISDASRPIKDKEIKACLEAGISFIELPIAFDALTVVTNPSNDWAKEMTVEQLKKAWGPDAQGKVLTWNQVIEGAPNQPLKLFGPGADSGTFDYFTEAVMDKSGSIRGDFTASEDDNILVQGVSGDKGGLGYFGLAYYLENKDKLKAVAIKNKDGKFVLPSEATVMDGTYNPLSRPLFIYLNATKAAFDPNVKKFVEFYLKHAGEMSKEVGYIPLNADEYTAITEHYKQLKTGSAFDGKAEIGLRVKDILGKVKND